MTPKQYIDNLNKRYTQGIATVDVFRGDLQQLLECLVPDGTFGYKSAYRSLTLPESWKR